MRSLANRNLFVLSVLFTLFLSMSGPLQGQKQASRTISKTEHLHRLALQIEQSSKKRLPKEIEAKADSLFSAALQQKSVPYLVIALSAKEYAISELDHQRFPQLFTLTRQVDALLDHLTPYERSVWTTAELSLILNHSSSVLGEVPTEQYALVLLQRMAQDLPLVEHFPKPLAPYKEAKTFLFAKDTDFFQMTSDEILQHIPFALRCIAQIEWDPTEEMTKLPDTLRKLITKLSTNDPQRTPLYQWIEKRIDDEAILPNRWGEYKAQKDKEIVDLSLQIDSIMPNPWSTPLVLWLTEEYCHKQEFHKAAKVLSKFLSLYPKKKNNSSVDWLQKRIHNKELDFGLKQRNFLPQDSISLYVRSRNIGQYTLSIHPVDVVRQGNLVSSSCPPILVQQQLPHPQQPHTEVTDTLTLPALPIGNYSLSIREYTQGDSTSTKLSIPFYVTDQYALILHNSSDKDSYAQLLDAHSGQPLQGQFHTYVRESQKENTTSLQQKTTQTSSPLGTFLLPIGTEGLKSTSPQSAFITLPTVRENHTNWLDPLMEELQGWINTDRRLYRPGQKLHYSATIYSIGTKPEQSKLIANKQVTATLYNTANDPIGEQNLTTDRYGSVSGEWQLPENGVMGNYSIILKIEDEQIASTHILVEEYKRPSFEVRADSIQGFLGIGQNVVLHGFAKTLSGAALQGAKIEYQVLGSYHQWNCFFNQQEKEKILQQGNVETDTESGEFLIPTLLSSLKPQPEENEEKDLFEYHTFKWIIKVIAPSGEIREAIHSIFIGDKELHLRIQDLSTLYKEEKNSGRQIVFVAEDNNSKLPNAEITYTLRREEEKNTEQWVEQGSAKANIPYTIPLHWFTLPSGRYSLVLSYRLPSGKEYTSTPHTFEIFSQSDKYLSLKEPLWVNVPKKTFTLQEPPCFFLASSLPQAPIFMSVSWEEGVEPLQMLPRAEAYRLQKITLPLPRSKNKGYIPQKINVLLYTISEGAIYRETFQFEQQRLDQKLSLEWLSFRDRIQAGENETWHIRIKKPNGKPATNSRIVAWMSDASLDLMKPNAINCFSHKSIPVFPQWSVIHSLTDFQVPSLYDQLGGRLYGYAAAKSAAPEALMAISSNEDNVTLSDVAVTAYATGGGSTEDDATKVVPRTNFAETAYFLPLLESNSKGEVSWSATLPESITRWRINLLAYDNLLNHVTEIRDIEAYKEFTIEPFVPRFVRIGDEVRIDGTLRSLMNETLYTQISFEVFDPITDSILHTEKQSIELLAQEVKGFSFPFHPIKGYGVVGVRFLAQAGSLSDGEQHLLVQQPAGKRITQTHPIRNTQQSTYTYNPKELFPTEKEGELNGATLTIDILSNPLLLVMQSLPLLEMSSTPNSIGLSAAAYGNILAALLLTRSDVQEWLLSKKKEQPNTLLHSPLHLRQDLKQLNLEETLWKSAAQAEQERIEQMLTFMKNPQQKAKDHLLNLSKLQNSGGHWSWYPGMPPSPHLTPIILEHLGSLLPLSIGMPEEQALIRQMIKMGWNGYLAHLIEQYNSKTSSSKKSLLYPSMEYLFLYHHCKRDQEQRSKEESIFFNFALNLLEQEARTMPLTTLPMSGIALHKSGKEAKAKELATILANYITYDTEQGAFFANLGNSYFWYNPYMRMQLSAAELLSLVGGHSTLISAMKQWVLSQKRSTHWGSTLSSLWAIETLLGKNEDNYFSNDTITVTVPLKNDSSKVLKGGEIAYRQDATDLNLERPININHSAPSSPLWGGLYTSFYQEYRDIKANSQQELSLQRVFKVQRIKDGQTFWEKVNETDSLQVGDRIRTSLILSTDKAMDFVSLSDIRPGCCEPVVTLSNYEWNGNIGYYREVRDGETRFFFDHLNRGTYTIEYDQWIVRPGVYTPGIASIQSSYAPEYGANTEGEKELLIVPNNPLREK